MIEQASKQVSERAMCRYQLAQLDLTKWQKVHTSCLPRSPSIPFYLLVRFFFPVCSPSRIVSVLFACFDGSSVQDRGAEEDEFNRNVPIFTYISHTLHAFLIHFMHFSYTSCISHTLHAFLIHFMHFSYTSCISHTLHFYRASSYFA